MYDLLEDFLYDKVCESQPVDESLAMERAVFRQPNTTKNRYDVFIDELGLTREAFEDTYIHSLNKLTTAQLMELVGYWNMSIGRLNGWLFSVNQRASYDTIRWLLYRLHIAQIPGLDLFEIDLEDYSGHEHPQDNFFRKARGRADVFLLGKNYGIPYKQCQYCGRTTTDPRGAQFGRQKFCHYSDCDTSNKDVSRHNRDCCYRAMMNFKQLVRLKKKQWAALSDRPEELKSSFHEFLQKQFNLIAALDLPPIRPKSEITHAMRMLIYRK